MVSSIGADRVIDYTHEDFTIGDERYDVIIDSAVSHSISETRRALAPNGIYVLFGDSGGRLGGGFRRSLQTLLLAPIVRQTMRSFTMAPSRDDLQFLKELIEAGRVTPIIDRTYQLSDAPEALGYLATGHARGKVIITV